jgi:hypothetical protein
MPFVLRQIDVSESVLLLDTTYYADLYQVTADLKN